MRLLIPEIFEKVDKAESIEQKKALLIQHNSPVLQDVLRINFHPEVKMQLPEGDPPYNKDKMPPLGLADTNLYKEMRRFYTWISPPPNLNKIKRESLFIQLLESINLKEAELVCAIKDKKLEQIYSSISEDLVRQTFPQLLPEKTVVNEQQEEPDSPKRSRGRPKKNA